MLTGLTSSLFAQAALLGLEALLVAALLLTLFRLRHTLGLAPVYMTLGVLSQITSLMSASVYVRFTPDLLIGPGSAVLFPAFLFAILFIYIREDARAARQAIYGLMVANAVIALLALLAIAHLKSTHAFNPLALPVELFIVQPRVMVVGSLTLLADTILTILLYEYLGRFLSGQLFLRIYVTLTSILLVDTVLFVTGAFYEHPSYSTIMISDMVGKSCAALLYSSLLTMYLRLFDLQHACPGENSSKLAELLQVLTYREKYEALQLQSTVDQLTGVHNRGYFDAALERLLIDRRQTGRSLTVLFIDVDHFKAINDSRGHAEGDRVLVAIAEAIRETARGSDIVARYGGEEFAMLLPDTSAEDGERVAEHVRRAIPLACHRINASSGGLQTTVTIGVAAAPLDASDSETLLRIADMRLYAGKRGGRNRVVGARQREQQVA